MIKVNIIFIILCFAFASFQPQAVAFSGGHDSILYDGAEKINILYDDDCVFEVKQAAGSVEGMVRVKVKAMGCGVGDDSVYSWERRKVRTGDMIKADEEIKTGSDGFIKIGLPDGSVIILDKDSRLTFNKEMCDQPGKISLFFGRIWTRIKKALGGAKYEVTTERAVTGVRGTEFTVSTDEKVDIIRVYEGSVEVLPQNKTVNKSMDRKEEELQKITDDFQAGKITMEEYMQKSMALADEMKNMQAVTPVVVDAGNKCTVDSDGNISGSVPIDAGDDKWFENVFK